MKISRLIDILKVQSVSYHTELMEQYIFSQVENIEGAVLCYDEKNRNLYIQKGKDSIFPCVVAHTDTVHDICKTFDVVNVKGNLTGYNYLTMEPHGIGGDDKVGIFIALEMLRKFENIKIAFFSDEEVGCCGSYEANLDFFKDCAFILQFDRRGNKDLVSHAFGIELASKAFRDDLTNIAVSFGYKFTTGMMTDVMALREIGVNVSCVNISCGYYRPHMPDEYVNVQDVANAVNLCEAIILGMSHKQYKVGKIGKRYKYYNTPSSTGKFESKTAKVCDCCNNVSADVKYHNYFKIDMCTDCLDWIGQEKVN